MSWRKAMWLAVVIPPLAIAAFVLFWLGITQLLSHVGGWSVLGERYPARTVAGEKDLGTASLTLDRGFMVVNYNRSVRFQVSSEGLEMTASRFFRRGHPPVLIPWGEVASCERKKLLVGEGAALTLRDGSVNLLVRGPAAEGVLAAWEARAPAP
jgi:hypothetical protein